MRRLTRWLVGALFRVKALQDLDTEPRCRVCGVPVKGGHHDFGQWVES